ncbi:MAG: DNA gyrase subunit B [Chitinivibrionia bacterium]|nr:DNA gyrase subunit B [Chitinivibrionia bacterium]
MSDDAKKINSDYDADDIKSLKGLEAVRKRPAMYIGSTGSAGLHHLVYEIVDNAIDEALAGYCDRVEVVIHANNGITVKDNGRGIPVGWNKEENMTALELVLCTLHAGGKFDNSNYKVSGGLHGVGSSCVNALSYYMRAEIKRDGRIYEMEFERGDKKDDLKVIGETTERGTTISFYPDPQIFEETKYSFKILTTSLREKAFLNKGIKILITDERENTPEGVREKLEDGKENPLWTGRIAGEPTRHEFCFPNGIIDYVKYLNGAHVNAETGEIAFDEDTKKQLLLPDPVHFNHVEPGMELDVAFQYNDGYDERVFSFANNINTRDGGTHLLGFRNGVWATIEKYIDENRENIKALKGKQKDGKAKKGKEKDEKAKKEDKIKIERADLWEGLTAVVSVKLSEPQFEGQTKQKLGNSGVSAIVNKNVQESLGAYLQENPKIAEEICNKIVNAAIAREAARNAQENVRKVVREGRGKSEKLTDCTSKIFAEREVFLVEGNSAGGTAKRGRNPKTQAIFCLRGKIINVEKARIDKVLMNKEIEDMIFRVFKCGIGDTFDMNTLRYNKIIIMTDADVDGAHIRTLLLTFFYRKLPKLIEEGHVYIACPPLFRIKAGKIDKYVHSEEEKEKVIEENNLKESKSVKVSRFKGLGEMNPEELSATTMHQKTRYLKKVFIEDAIEADRIFMTLMGEEVEPRKRFIEENADKADIDA